MSVDDFSLQSERNEKDRNVSVLFLKTIELSLWWVYSKHTNKQSLTINLSHSLQNHLTETWYKWSGPRLKILPVVRVFIKPSLLGRRWVKHQHRNLLFANISTGEPSCNNQGHPLNCQAGPWTNTATTRSLHQNGLLNNTSLLKSKLKNFIINIGIKLNMQIYLLRKT